MASAGDGLVAVGANVILLPSSYFDNDIEWKAMTWVYNTGVDYGEWSDTNPNYNNPVYEPTEDANGLMWYEPGFDTGEKFDEDGVTPLDWNADKDEPIYWEEHTAPFSSDATWNGRPSYVWTGNSIIADIYVRRTFTIPADQLLSGPVFLACGHDDAPCEYYINGELVFERTGFEGEWIDDNGNYHYSNGWNNGEYIQLTDEQKELIKLNGEENVVAFHVHQNWGGAFADCGLYTKIEGGLDMGYTTPWVGKVLFNSFGGYNWDGQSPSNNPRHPWSALYEAQEGDEYTFLLEGSVEDEPWMERLQFRTPIRIEEGHYYNFKARIKTDKTIDAFTIALTDNDNTDEWLASDEYKTIDAPYEGEEDYEGTLIDLDFMGQEGFNNFMIDLDFGNGQDSTTITISEISLRDVSPELDVDYVELWVGTHYFNVFDMHKTTKKFMIWDETLNDGEGGWREAVTDEEKEMADEEFVVESIDAPEIQGRVETQAWTLPDFDDSMWDEQMMPVGSNGGLAPESGLYMAEQQSYWANGTVTEGENKYSPTGDNSNYWIRRNFELDEINTKLSYELNVCHDDVYETYVNGHLLQKNVGWTNGKGPVQVHIPAKYLNIGKNVIATYIQQNWGGRFYDCGINVTEIDYNDCLKQFNDALAYAQTDTLLTHKMWDAVDAIVAEALEFYNENKNDAAELRNYAKELKASINAVFAYSKDVKTLKDTYEICRKMEDKGYWGTTLEDAVVALDTCAVPSQWTGVLDNLRNARKATAMERHTENYKGSVPQAVAMDQLGHPDMLDEYDDIIGPNPKYYIYNVGTKNFLGAGEAWGAHMAIQYASNPMMVVQASNEIIDEETDEITTENIEGAYYIETFRPNGELGFMDFLGWNGFVDVGMGNREAGENLWEIIPVEGKENVFYIAQYGQTFPTDTTYNQTDEGVEEIITGGGKKYLGMRGDNNYAPSYYLVDTDCKTPELENNQWMFISREEMLSLTATASQSNPVDLTCLIQNPGYDQRLSIDDWMFTNGSVWGRGGDHPNFVLESYDTKEFQNYQEIYPEEADKALPAGTYMLTVQGYYRDGHESVHIQKVLAHQPILQRAYIFAGTDGSDMETFQETCATMPLMPIHIESGKYPGIGYSLGGMQMPGTYDGQPYSACSQAADDYFAVGLYLNKLVFYITDEDVDNEPDNRHLSFGINMPYDEETTIQDWIVMDNWRLKYYGSELLDADGIKGIESDEIKNVTTASKGIYNMLGQRLSKAQKGVNIINGKKIIKK